jgi:SAM-dependent methyltransferase
MGLKLHVGCGSDLKPGYVNIDEFNPKADVKMPLQKLDYPDGSLDAVEGYMVIEHLDPQDAVAFVRNVHRMLAPGGRLILECPDLEKVSRLALVFADDTEYMRKGAFGLRGFFGEPTDHMVTGDYHKWGYTPASALRLLREGGFSKCSVSDAYSHCYPLRDLRMEAVK